ncbi:response regulator [Pseudomonas sp. R5-89-07]|uniref:response regulator n=1 Tax=Pseudomonas sp. R5-89-07 TaxID=658644 RepID=UPI000F563255|nr:response regulator [Pseudomonas sp. R5-89-07]AZF03886.1 putative sensor/response hybrid [Pseudomonas sp. R5-89-07]
MPSANPPAHWQHLWVLVVEDHCTYRSLMEAFLDTLGVRHVVVGEGESALRVLASVRVDLVISDCRMPVMDGYTMSNKIRRRERALDLPRVPIVALTGSLTPDEITRCFDAGMDACLVKPLSLPRLRELLESWLPDAHGQRSTSGRWVVGACADWPTRAQLIETFGSQSVVDAMLKSLVQEARADQQALLQGQISLDAGLVGERLHRLVGSLAFLGAVELEQRCQALMADLRSKGVRANRSVLEQLLKDVCIYLDYLAEL